MIKKKLNKRNKIAMVLLICLLALLPYPTKAFYPLTLMIVDENMKPLAGVSGIFDFSEYPSLASKSIKFKSNDGGKVYIKEQLVWMGWAERRFYNLLSVISRSGWSDQSSTITVQIPHKKVETGLVRMAILSIDGVTLNQCSARSSAKYATTTYFGRQGQYWYIENSYSKIEDTIELYIQKSCDKTNSEIRLVMKTLDPASIGCK